MKQLGVKDKSVVKVYGYQPEKTLEALSDYMKRFSFSTADFNLAQICEPAEVTDFQLRIFGNDLTIPDIWISGLTCGQKATIKCLQFFGFKLSRHETMEILNSSTISKYYIKQHSGLVKTYTD